MSSYQNAADSRLLDHLPGVDGLPFFGEGIRFVTDLDGVVQRHFEEFGPVSRTKLVGQRGILVVGPDLWQQILLDKERNFSAEMGYAQQLGRFYRGGLLLRDFDEHRAQRRIFQSAFKSAAMKQYVDIINERVALALDDWQQESNILFFDRVKALLLDIGARIFIGVHKSHDEMAELNRAFEQMGQGTAALVRAPLPGSAYAAGQRGKRYMHRYFLQLLQQRRQQPGDDMLSHLCQERREDGSLFSDEEIIQHISFLLFAAHDTTTSTLTHMVMHTAGIDNNWQSRLRTEVQQCVDGGQAQARDHTGRPVLIGQSLEQLTQLEWVFQETLRLHPSVPVLTRRTVRACQLGGYSIPAHCMIFMVPSYNHQLPEYWSQPQQFDPLRFSPERAEHKHHPFCYTPFGGGAHKCIGMHFAMLLSRCFMSQFLQRFSYQTPLEYQPRLQQVPLAKPADHLPLQIQALNPAGRLDL